MFTTVFIIVDTTAKMLIENDNLPRSNTFTQRLKVKFKSTYVRLSRGLLNWERFKEISAAFLPVRELAAGFRQKSATLPRSQHPPLLLPVAVGAPGPIQSRLHDPTLPLSTTCSLSTSNPPESTFSAPLCPGRGGRGGKEAGNAVGVGVGGAPD